MSCCGETCHQRCFEALESGDNDEISGLPGLLQPGPHVASAVAADVIFASSGAVLRI